jgi:hypothetical protein
MKTLKYILNPKATTDPDSVIDRYEKFVPFERRIGGQKLLLLAKKRILTHLVVQSIEDIGLEAAIQFQSFGVTIYSSKGSNLEYQKLYRKSIPKSANNSQIEAFLEKPKSKRIAKALQRNLSLRETAKLCDCSVNLVRKVQKYVEIMQNN